MIIGIDASNIRTGGGVTHLVEVLRAGDPEKYGIDEVVVYCDRKLQELMSPKPWLKFSNHSLLEGAFLKDTKFGGIVLNRGWLRRLSWKKFVLPKLLKECDVLFVPGGVYSGKFRPYVTMFQSMLPFKFNEFKRYFPHIQFFRILLLRFLQGKTFKKANGVICLSGGGKEILESAVKNDFLTVIPHGIKEEFYGKVKIQRSLSDYSDEKPFRLLYVSIIDVYKHQWQIVKAVAKLRERGLPVILDLVGSAYKPALKKLNKAIAQYDPNGDFIHYLGAIPYNQLSQHYANADAFVFASSCETFGMPLLEAMAIGLPIACSDHSVMPSILKDAGVYFDPENADNVAQALESLLNDVRLRQYLAQKARAYAKQYSWKKCANKTFEFIGKIGKEYKK
jgi:glycosyltransferase involved in cell wall biosynthesis